MLPAYAGMIRPVNPSINPSVCAPRVCGDDPSSASPETVRTWCSPRMRG